MEPFQTPKLPINARAWKQPHTTDLLTSWMVRLLWGGQNTVDELWSREHDGVTKDSNILLSTFNIVPSVLQFTEALMIAPQPWDLFIFDAGAT